MPELHDLLADSANKAIGFFESCLKDDGTLGERATDLSCYYKVAMMFLVSGKAAFANRVLDYIKAHFLQASGDFMTGADIKSAKGEYTEFWGYTNGWVVRAAQMCGREDIAGPGLEYLAKYAHPSNGGCLTHQLDVESPDLTTDVLMTAHMGLIHLEGERIDLALKAGDYLCAASDKQPELERGFYLRLNADSNVITEYPDAAAAVMIVERAKPGQLYFMLGYPIAYLTLLFEKTGDVKYLDSAKRYADFALSCHEDFYISNFSHKVAWSLSLLYRHERDPRYLDTISRITTHFTKSQNDTGTWYNPDEDINTAFDQSAEIAIWLIEIAKNVAPEGAVVPFFSESVAAVDGGAGVATDGAAAAAGK